MLVRLPSELRLNTPSGTRVLGVHVSPASDDGRGIKLVLPDDQLASPLAGCDADIVIGCHTHCSTNRVIGRMRALNPGSVGVPERLAEADWLLLEFDHWHRHHPGPGATAALRAERRAVPFDADAVVRDLHARLHPNAEILEGILTGKRKQIGH